MSANVRLMSPRKDAARNHARLVEAAATVFRRDGVDAPLDTVAVQAGVGRATRRRHDSLIPRSDAILATGCWPERARSTARRRNSGGLAAGIQDSSPRRSSPQTRCPEKRVRLR